MFTVATRARAWAAPGLLAAASVILWALDADGHLSEHGDRLDLTAAATLSIIAAVTGFSCRAHAQRERLRKMYEADRDLYTLALKARLSPHGDGGGQAPRQAGRPAWVRYYPSEPAA